MIHIRKIVMLLVFPWQANPDPFCCCYSCVSLFVFVYSFVKSRSFLLSWCAKEDKPSEDKHIYRGNKTIGMSLFILYSVSGASA